MTVRFFSVGCSVRVLETASECVRGGKEPVTVKVPNAVKGQVYIVDWLGWFTLRVRHNGVDMYFDKKDVMVV